MGDNAFMHASTDITIIQVDADLDAAMADRVRDAIDAVIARGCRRVVLSLNGVLRIDRDGMAMLLTEIRAMRARGGLLSMVNVQERAYRTLRNTRIVDVAPVSVAGPRPRIPRLAPDAKPVWRRALKVDASHMDDTRKRVDELVCSMGFSSDDAFDLVLAIGEAMGNAVDHASGEVIITIAAYTDRAVVEVTDGGCGFEIMDDEVACTVVSSERGRGIMLMRMLADSVTVCRRPSGLGTCVRIVKLIHH